MLKNITNKYISSSTKQIMFININKLYNSLSYISDVTQNLITYYTESIYEETSNTIDSNIIDSNTIDSNTIDSNIIDSNIIIITRFSKHTIDCIYNKIFVYIDPLYILQDDDTYIKIKLLNNKKDVEIIFVKIYNNSIILETNNNNISITCDNTVIKL